MSAFCYLTWPLWENKEKPGARIRTQAKGRSLAKVKKAMPERNSFREDAGRPGCRIRWHQ